MFIVPMSSVVQPLESVERVFGGYETEQAEDTGSVKAPSFFDIFSSVFTNAVETNAQKQDDIFQLMLGDTDTEQLAEMQSNIAKAEIATTLLVTVKNAAVDAYNEIARMNV